MKYFIVVFGCAANEADAERIKSGYEARGWKLAKDVDHADEIIIVTCMIRESAEDRVYGLVRNIGLKRGKHLPSIIVTGCLVGMLSRDSTGKLLKKVKKRLPQVSQFLPIEEVGFTHPQTREDKSHALVVISNGCNNFCSYCVVPFARGREVSRPFEDIISECEEVAKSGYSSITLLGQNVNSYGSDIVNVQKEVVIAGKRITPVMVKHLGKNRIPTLFPFLLEKVAQIPGIMNVDFLSSNPWDFSDELIAVIAKNTNVSRAIHLPIQSGDGEVLKRMNRWYTPKEYSDLVQKIRKTIPGVSFSTDIIVGFPGESKNAFENTVKLASSVGFTKAYVAMYSSRPMTVATKEFPDTIPYIEKKRRWKILETLINTPNLRKKKNRGVNA